MGAATDRTLPRPGQALTFAKNKLAIKAGRRRQSQAPPTGLEGFLQVLQMIEDFAFGEADQLRKSPGGQRLYREGLP